MAKLTTIDSKVVKTGEVLEAQRGASGPIEVVAHPKPSRISQIATTIKLLAVIGLVGLVLWLLDRSVSG